MSDLPMTDSGFVLTDYSVTQATLVEFLNKRLDEDQQRWESLDIIHFYPRWFTGSSIPMPLAPEVLRSRLLLDVAAKRAIVRNCANVLEEDADDDGHPKGFSDGTSGVTVAQHTLLALAQPFRDHPDFRAEWAASGDGDR